ncbi:MAG: nucleoid-associated protein [Muribaculaceae bacterium]|nr:nucleoid-associated protein [Muribaculaceae bacterium]
MRANFINSFVTGLAVHIVGNKIADDGCVLSSACLSISKDLNKILTNYFLGSFSSDEYYQLFHDSSLNLNEVYSFVSEIFNNPDSLYSESINLAKHLYNESIYPNIKVGEFYVVYFKETTFDGEEIDVLGLFKTESKQVFLKSSVKDNNVNITKDEGVDLKKLDKGCLIFNKNKETGYIVAVIDNTNKGNQAKYWIEDFLHVKQIKDSYSSTENVMSLTKSFVTKGLSRSDEISKKEQVDLLNKSLQYFKENDSFNIDDFEKEVIANPDMVMKFRSYKEEYESTRNINIENEFMLSDSAFKKQQRSYKRTINLDKKIQITINGNSDNIEKGIDAKGTFYKIYYSNEE